MFLEKTDSLTPASQRMAGSRPCQRIRQAAGGILREGRKGARGPGLLAGQLQPDEFGPCLARSTLVFLQPVRKDQPGKKRKRLFRVERLLPGNHPQQFLLQIRHPTFRG